MNRTILTCVMLTFAAREASAQARCSENREMGGTLGIARFDCVGRS
jgi:hypothetical protein